MQPGLNCVQFEKQIQGLLDSRQALDSDARLTHHSRECERCRELLASYQSLEDSFSGKLFPACRITLQNINRLNEAAVPGRWSQYAPVATLLLTGLFAGIWFNSSTPNLDVPTANRERPFSEQNHPSYSAWPSLGNHQNLPPYRIPGWTDSQYRLQNVQTRLKAMNPMLIPGAVLPLYFRYAIDLPTALKLRSSFQCLYLWLQEQLSQTTELPSKHQHQNRVEK